MIWVLFKLTYPEDLDLLSFEPLDLLLAFIVNRDCKDINELAILIRVGVVIFRRGNHDVRCCVEVDNI